MLSPSFDFRFPHPTDIELTYSLLARQLPIREQEVPMSKVQCHIIISKRLGIALCALQLAVFILGCDDDERSQSSWRDDLGLRLSEYLGEGIGTCCLRGEIPIGVKQVLRILAVANVSKHQPHGRRDQFAPNLE